MKTAVAVLAALTMLACAKKGADGRYHVVTPSAENEPVRKNTEEATAKASDTIQRGVQELGESVREGARDIAQSEAGQRIKSGAKEATEGLKSAGREVKEHAKPGDQP